MTSLGIIRKLDEVGRVTIPKEFCKTLCIKNGDPVEISSEGNRVIIQKVQDIHTCCSCQEEKSGMITLGNRSICVDCLDKFNVWRALE